MFLWRYIANILFKRISGTFLILHSMFAVVFIIWRYAQHASIFVINSHEIVLPKGLSVNFFCRIALAVPKKPYDFMYTCIQVLALDQRRHEVHDVHVRGCNSDIWAPSSEFVSSSIPSWQILTAHAQPFRGARDLAFCLKVPLDSLLVWGSREGSGETARVRRLAWTFAARIGDKYQIRLTRSILKYELRHEKTCLRGFRLGKTQTSPLSYRS